MSCSIWIGKDGIKKIIGDLLDHDESEPLYQGHKIDELYIEDDGAMEGFIEIDEVGVSIQIPFDEWFKLFKKYKAFKSLRLYLEKRIEQEKMTLEEFQELFQSSNQTMRDET